MWLSCDCHVTYQTDPYFALSTLVIWVHCKSSDFVNVYMQTKCHNRCIQMFPSTEKLSWFASTVICKIFINYCLVLLIVMKNYYVKIVYLYSEYIVCASSYYMKILQTKLMRIMVFNIQVHVHVHRSRTFPCGYGVQLTWRDIEQTLYRLSLSFAVTGIDPILESLECVSADLWDVLRLETQQFLKNRYIIIRQHYMLYIIHIAWL